MLIHYWYNFAKLLRINVKHGPVKLLDVEIGKRMLHLDRVRHLKKGELIYSKQHFKKVYVVLKKKTGASGNGNMWHYSSHKVFFFRSEDRILCEILLSYSWLHPGDSVFYILSLNFPTTTTTLISNKTSSKRDTDCFGQLQNQLANKWKGVKELCWECIYHT